MSINKQIETNDFFKVIFRGCYLHFKIQHILKERIRDEIVSNWASHGIAYDHILDLFEEIRIFSGWINCYYEPEDDLVYLLKAYNVGLELAELLTWCEERYEVNFDEEKSFQTLIELVKICYKMDKK